MSPSKLWEGWQPPRELNRPLPRPVRLTGSGTALFALSVLLVVGSAAATVKVAVEGYRMDVAKEVLASRMIAEGQETDGVVTNLRIGGGRTRFYDVDYRFQLNGWRYDARATIRQQHWRELRIGGPIAVRYLPSDPTHSYPSADPPRLLRTWPLPVFFGSIMAAGGAVLLFMVLRERRLLANGTPAPAAVTRWTLQRTRGGGALFTGYYEFPLAGGGTCQGSYDSGSQQPVSGTAICVLYDPNRPRRNTKYPVSLTKIAAE